MIVNRIKPSSVGQEIKIIDYYWASGTSYTAYTAYIDATNTVQTYTLSPSYTSSVLSNSVLYSLFIGEYDVWLAY